MTDHEMVDSLQPSISSTRYNNKNYDEKISPNIEFVTKVNQNYTTVINQNRVFKIKTKSFSDDTNLFLLANTLGRSGSSWIYSLLDSTDENTVSLFEPLIKTKGINSKSLEILSDIFLCQMGDEIINLAKVWSRVLATFKKKCGSRCKTINDYNERCRQSDTIVAKVCCNISNSAVFRTKNVLY